MRHPVSLDEAKKLLGVKPLHNNRRRADHCRDRRENERRGVVKRRRRQIDGVLVEAAHLAAQQTAERCERAERLIEKRPLDALRPLGRARRIEHRIAADLVGDRNRRHCGDCRIPRLPAGSGASAHIADHVRRDHRRRFTGDIGEAFSGDEDPGPAIGDDVADLARRQMRADRRVVEAAALRRPADLHEEQRILGQERDMVLRLEAEPAKQLRPLVRGPVQFAIGDRRAGPRHPVGGLVGHRARMDAGV
jgi:hypothetical protein